MKIFRISLSAVIVLVALLVAIMPAKAAYGDTIVVNFSYSCTNNLPNDVSNSIGQFQVVVRDETQNANDPKASFTFYNYGSFQSSITDIYFADGVLLNLASVVDGTGADFSQGATPPDLPGGNNCIPPFAVHAGFLADSNPPRQQNGVNNTNVYPDPAEWVTINYTLLPGTAFSDLVAGLNDGTVRIGIHVQGYASGGSESFVTGPGTAVKLNAFDAKVSRGKVNLSWATGTEFSNAGFNLYRAASQDGARVRVNGGLISADGGAASGASYKAADAPGYGTFYYWLEDVDTSGAATLHGPVKVTLAPALRKPVYRPSLPGGN